MTSTRFKVAAAALTVAGLAAAAVGVRSTSTGRDMVARFSQLSVSIAKSFGRQPAAATSTAARTSLSSEVERPALHIIVFKEAPLATYDGGVSGLEEAPRIMAGADVGKIDVKSDEAVEYVQFLKQQQIRHEADLGRLASGPVRVHARMQHALNAIIAEVSPADAQRMRNDPSVLMIDEYREVELHTEAGPALIGSEKVWAGTTKPFMQGARGEGMVVGIIDTGINWGSPSFAAVSPVDGYTHVNPLGTGNYLGSCAPGQVDEGRCNSKLIGGYDFVCDVTVGAGTYCSQPTLYREEPGFGDTNTHGSHVAGTAAGNIRDVMFKNVPLRISGVAPRANIVAFDVCFTNLATGGGSCPNVSSVQAVNQAIADGVVDALNFSIGGGGSPWNDAVSMAFLNAVDAGIYVAASAGNSGPGPNTMSHNEPWVSTTAASQHGRGDFQYVLSVTGPTPVPANLQQIFLTEGSGGTAHSAALPGNTPLRASAGINTANDGCAAFPANAFQNAIAVVRRGSCPFSDKVNNAAAAGAVAVVIANNQAGAISPSVPGTTVPAFSISQAEGNAIATFASANATTTASISYPPVVVPNTPDQLAAFSSRGPAGNLSIIKPDITAPGVNILAAVAGTTLTGHENSVGLLSGTSMASPHNAGAALLVRQLRPTWTPMEVKSAMMMTSKAAVLMQDGTTLADPFSRGTGRIQVDLAARAGLVLNETKANFLAANPAANGDPSTLNLASLMNRSCYNTCTFTRTFKSAASQTQTWNASLTGFSSATVSPSTFTVAPGASVTLTVTVQGSASGIAANGAVKFGELSLVPQSGPTLRLPVGIAIQPPVFNATPNPVSVTVPANGRASASFALQNTGGGMLSANYRSTGTATALVMNQPLTGLGSGYISTTFSDPANAGGLPGLYAADDFSVGTPTQLTSIVANGFTVNGAALTTATNITWSIYPDAGGVPSGNPVDPTNTAVWQYTAAPNATGVTISGGNVSLNLGAAGQTLTLPPGRYWLVVSPRLTVAGRFAWYQSGVGDNVFATLTPNNDGTGTWTQRTNVAGVMGLAGSITGSVACGAPWLVGASPSRAMIDPGKQYSASVSVHAAGLSAGVYSAYACFATNDPVRPVAPVLVRMTVTP